MYKGHWIHSLHYFEFVELTLTSNSIIPRHDVMFVLYHQQNSVDTTTGQC